MRETSQTDIILKSLRGSDYLEPVVGGDGHVTYKVHSLKSKKDIEDHIFEKISKDEYRVKILKVPNGNIQRLLGWDQIRNHKPEHYDIRARVEYINND